MPDGNDVETFLREPITPVSRSTVPALVEYQEVVEGPLPRRRVLAADRLLLDVLRELYALGELVWKGLWTQESPASILGKPRATP